MAMKRYGVLARFDGLAIVSSNLFLCSRTPNQRHLPVAYLPMLILIVLQKQYFDKLAAKLTAAARKLPAPPLQAQQPTPGASFWTHSLGLKHPAVDHSD